MEPGLQHSLDEALTISTQVVPESGQWAVYMEVTFPDVVRRFHVGTYRSEQRAKIQARYVRRYADLPPGLGSLGF
ncbi:MAG: AP2 domain-containing protein [Bacteroidota bacterium]